MLPVEEEITFEVGDRVIIVNGPKGTGSSKVERITKTQYILENKQRFRRDNRSLVGGSDYYVTYIKKATPEALHKLAAQISRSQLSRMNWGNVPDTAVVEITKIINKAKEKI